MVDIKLMVKLGYRLLMMMVKGSARFAILLYPYSGRRVSVLVSVLRGGGG